MLSVPLCSRFRLALKKSHINAMKRIPIYLSWILTLGLQFQKGYNLELAGYFDANYAACKVDKKNHIRDSSIYKKVTHFMAV